MCKFVPNAWHVLLAFSKVVMLCLHYTILFDLFSAHKMCKFVPNAWHVLLAFSKVVMLCLYYTILFDLFSAHKLYYAYGAATMLF